MRSPSLYVFRSRAGGARCSGPSTDSHPMAVSPRARACSITCSWCIVKLCREFQLDIAGLHVLQNVTWQPNTASMRWVRQQEVSTTTGDRLQISGVAKCFADERNRTSRKGTGAPP